MSSFPITTKAAPPPDPPRRRWVNHKYPFTKLAVGDMFFIPDRSENTFAAYASQFGRKLGWSFSTRLCWCRQEVKDGPWLLCKEEDDGAVQGIGVWRQADPVKATV